MDSHVSYEDQIMFAVSGGRVWHVLNKLAEKIENGHPYRGKLTGKFFRDLAVHTLINYCVSVDKTNGPGFLSGGVERYFDRWINSKAYELSLERTESPQVPQRSSIDNWLMAEEKLSDWVLGFLKTPV